MRYENNGIEVQCNECQIIREAAHRISREEDYGIGLLIRDKKTFVLNILEIGRKDPLLRDLCDHVLGFLLYMDDAYFNAFTGYVAHLTRSTDIELMKPFFLENGKVVLAVNMHEEKEYLEMEYESETGLF